MKKDMSFDTYRQFSPAPAPAPAGSGVKHIVVNEGLITLDAASQIRLHGFELSEPPTQRESGRTYATSGSSVGDWVGHPIVWRLMGSETGGS